MEEEVEEEVEREVQNYHLTGPSLVAQWLRLRAPHPAPELGAGSLSPWGTREVPEHLLSNMSARLSLYAAC